MDVERLLLQTRLLTILGAGGNGKTRLSLKVGDELLTRYPGGVWFVDLAPVADEALFARAVAAALRVREDTGADLMETLLSHLAPRQALLILDNCEHLVGAAARFAQQVLVHSSEVTILATSREALGLTGEVAWPLPGLALPPESVTPPKEVPPPSRLMRYEAIQLFVERAAAVSPGFRLTAANGPCLARICRRLDGIPLAMELAAAWMSALSPEQIDKHLLDEEFLESVDPTAPERQRTLRGTMDWSYGLLTVAEQTLWRRISVFAGSFTQEAAAAVCTDELLPSHSALRALRGLVRKSILLRDSTLANRYRLLETVREYGLEKLKEANELPVFRLRHLEFFTALAEEAEPHLRGPNQKEWLERLEEEHPNLRAALTKPENIELALRLSSAVLWFWLVRGYLVEGKHYLQQLLNSFPLCTAKTRAKSFRASGILATQLHLYDEAEIYLQKSYQLFKQLDMQSDIAITVSNLGINSSKKGDFKNAIQSLDESLHYYKKINDENRVFLISLNIGATYLKTNLPEKSKKIFQSILPLINKIEDKNSVLILYINLGMANNLNKEYIEAFKNALKSFKISTGLKNELLTARILWVITEALYHTEGNPTWIIPLLGKIDSSLAKNCEPLDNQATDLYTSFVQQLQVITEPTMYENLFTQGANFSQLDILEFLQNIERQISKTNENI
ncbi:hypothetical protein [Armatimonas sp.]|uniref:hypothetical protein n=1 Tax=Armatimonas sp. TaxID=1872638 RepID=UPI0037538C35